MMKRILVVGGANGVGLAIATELAVRESTEKVYVVDKAVLAEEYNHPKIEGLFLINFWKRTIAGYEITLPFEFTEIPCPKKYDPIMRTQYGDYMKFVKGGQIHTMALCDPDTPFKEKLFR